jgi:hypothetical protein
MRSIKDLQNILTTKDDLRRIKESIERFGHPYGSNTITCAPIEKSLIKRHIRHDRHSDPIHANET